MARERSGRIAHELALERAFRRSTRALDARAAGPAPPGRAAAAAERRMGEALPAPQDRAALERLLLTTDVEAVQADCGRLSELGETACCSRAW